ncbi:hypothetical protein KKC32_01215 [Patescibacteria group bacterium]|nr:hypothetical protein [Patescibacteria group bacterium]
MAESNRLKKQPPVLPLAPELKKEIAPEEKTAQGEKEKIERVIAELKHFVDDYEIMEESHMSPELYGLTGSDDTEEKQAARELAKENKLRTNWFSVILEKLKLIQKKFNLDQSESVSLYREFMQILDEEKKTVFPIVENRFSEEELRRTIFDSEEERRAHLNKIMIATKQAAREVAPVFRERKISLIKKIDAEAMKTIKTLEEKLKSL